jgi:LuxR family maltose regulon positive regulatory protein
MPCCVFCPQTSPGRRSREIYLSVNTVNTHVRGIYAELDARDRSTAVERARELRLLSAGVTG